MQNDAEVFAAALKRVAAKHDISVKHAALLLAE